MNRNYHAVWASVVQVGHVIWMGLWVLWAGHMSCGMDSSCGWGTYNMDEALACGAGPVGHESSLIVLSSGPSGKLPFRKLCFQPGLLIHC